MGAKSLFAGAAWEPQWVIVLLKDRQCHGLGTGDVRFWHLADIDAASQNVRFRG